MLAEQGGDGAAAGVAIEEFLLAVGGEEAQRGAAVVGAPGEVAEELVRAGVGGVQVVEDDQDGAGGGEVAEQGGPGPEEAVAFLLGATGGAGRHLAQRGQEGGEFGVLGAGPGPLGGVVFGEPAVEGGREDSVGGVVLGVLAAAPQDSGAVGGGATGCFGGQARLADARFAGEQADGRPGGGQ
ncbi:hypothetical protein GCM10025734_04730 [Kitasatospora paranensis]